MKGVNLVVHAGGKHVSRDSLSTIMVPESTDSYMPVRHEALLDLIETKIYPLGYRFGEQAHVTARDGNRYFGMVRLLNGFEGTDHGLIMGLRNSYDKSMAATLLFGAYVFLCDNLSYSAEVVIGRKHTPNILEDLPELISSGMARTSVFAKVQDTRFDIYKFCPIYSDAYANDLMVHILRQGVIQTSRFETMVNEWYEPSFDHGPKTAWRMFNACTQALKGTPAMDMPKRTMKLQSIMDDYASFNPAQYTFNQPKLIAA